MTFIVWDRGKVIAFDLERFGPVREVEEINRWVLPQRLAKLGLRPVARWLRNRRVRGWWDEAGPPDLVLCLGPIRSELVNYRPDDDAPVAALLGWRPLEEPESAEVTAALADLVIVPGDGADHPDPAAAHDPTTVEVGPPPSPFDHTARRWSRPEREALSRRLDLDPDVAVVVGLGPTDWRGAPDLLLRAVTRLRTLLPSIDAHLVWLGGDPAAEGTYPYVFDSGRLGLDEVSRWPGDPVDHVELLRRADLIALVGRDRYKIPNERRAPDFLETREVLSRLRVPIVALDTPANRDLADARTRWVPYPDTDGLAAAMADQLQPVPVRLHAAAPRLFDPPSP